MAVLFELVTYKLSTYGRDKLTIGAEAKIQV